VDRRVPDHHRTQGQAMTAPTPEEVAAALQRTTITPCDPEAFARGFNTGYEAAVSQGLADDPTLADEWLQEKLSEARREGAAAGLMSVHDIWGSVGRSIVRFGELRDSAEKILAGEWDRHIEWNIADIARARARAAATEAGQ
jgi:hypothetical protein